MDIKWIFFLVACVAVIGLVMLFFNSSGDMFNNKAHKIGPPAEQASEEFEQTELEAMHEGKDGDMMNTTEADMTSTQGDSAETPSVNPDVDARATLMIAGGCFWCVESDLEKLPGVLEAVSGYAGGTTENPTYSNYVSGGHREVVLVTYNPSVVSYREILIYEIKHMDPTDPDGSFYDRGKAYSPAIYYDNDVERTVALQVINEIDALKVYDKPIALEVLPLTTFWKAEDYHQDYYKGTLSALKYKYYRSGSGRDDFIKKHWGEDTGPTLPAEKSPFDLSTWEGFQKPGKDELVSSLTDVQYNITQKNGTERAFSNEYRDNHEEGIYVDIVSGEPLFSSRDKFDSGTGWPSFTKPIYPDAVTEHNDYKLILPRTEIRSRFGDSHLGHKFNDAPPELGSIRYCMNSASLRFIAKAVMEKEGYGQFFSAL